MREYIVNLRKHLILKNRYARTFIMLSRPDFVRHVTLDLIAGDVRDMSPETLGKIMCSFEIGDVMASKQELFEGVHFSGDCEEMLRELVSLCLAYMIRDRLSGQDIIQIARRGG